MAKYYLQWYRGATQKGSFSAIVPDSNANPWSWIQVGAVWSQNWTDFAGGCIQNSNQLLTFPIDMLFGINGTYAPGDQWYDLAISKGVSNFINLSELAVGDELYIGRQRSGSHLTVSAIGADILTFNYVCGDGTIAYSAVTWEILWQSGRFRCQSIPWITCMDTPGNYNITHYTMDLTSNFGFSAGYQTRVFAPTSTANAAKFWNNVTPVDDNNPYEDAGNTRPGGGNKNKQNFLDASDAVGVDALPTVSATSTGLVTIFSPTTAQVKHLSDVLWGKDFLSFLQNTVENISDLFISFGIVPFDMSSYVGNTVDITFFDWVVTLQQVSTNIPVRLVPNQFIEFDMGSINMETDPNIHKSDSVFDYSPYSRLGIYLPFIGFQELDIDEVRESTLHLFYRVDVLSGSCVARIDVTSHKDDKTRTLYQFTGNCLTQIPMSNVDSQTVITNAVNLGIALTSAGATSAVAGAGGEFVESQVAGGKLSAEGAAMRNKQYAAQVSNAEGSLAGATANAAMGIKPNFKHSGAVGASSSLLSVKQPYLFLTTPNEAVPRFYEKYSGLPSNITSKLGDLSGYTVVQDIRLNGLVATSPEVEEIYTLLKSGVII